MSIMFACPVFAAEHDKSRQLIEAVVVYAQTVCRYGGVLLGVFTLCQFLTSLHDNSPLKQSTARKLFTISIIMLSVSTCLSEIVDYIIDIVTNMINSI